VTAEGCNPGIHCDNWPRQKSQLIDPADAGLRKSEIELRKNFVVYVAFAV